MGVRRTCNLMVRCVVRTKTDWTLVHFARVTAWSGSLTPNPPKRWSLALTPWMMGKGRRTG